MLHPKPLSLSLSLIPLFLFFLPLTTSAFTLTRPPNNLGLVGYWSFDTSTIEGTTVHDLSGMGHHGTISGATPATGKMRQGVSFDGTNRINVGEVSLGGSDITLSMWVNTTSTNPSGGYLFGGWESPGPEVQFTTIFGDGKINMYSANTNTRITSNTAVNDGKWHHVVFQDVGNTMKIYIDGAEEVSGNAGSILWDDWKLTIGCGVYYGSSGFSGLLDDLRLYSRALSGEEISRLYESNNRSSSVTILPNDPTKHTTINTSQNNKLTDGLIGLWSFNGPDISGSTAYDRSGNNNNGTIYGATPTIGKVGQGMGFDENNDTRIEISDDDILQFGSGDLTLSA